MYHQKLHRSHYADFESVKGTGMVVWTLVQILGPFWSHGGVDRFKSLDHFGRMLEQRLPCNLQSNLISIR